MAKHLADEEDNLAQAENRQLLPRWMLTASRRAAQALTQAVARRYIQKSVDRPRGRHRRAMRIDAISKSQFSAMGKGVVAQVRCRRSALPLDAGPYAYAVL